MYSIPSGLCDWFKEVYETQAGPIRVNLRLFAGPHAAPIGYTEEASSPEATGKYIGSPSRRQNRRMERNMELLDSASSEVGNPWTLQLYEAVNFFYV